VTARRWRVAQITVSDSRVAGDDTSGDVVAARLAQLPADIVTRSVVADAVDDIRAAVSASLSGADLIVLTGGTGLGPRDVTPQAIRPLLDYEVPGMAEAMRSHGMRSTPYAMLSRQVAGVVRGRLVLSLPGSPRAVGESLDAVWDALPHALTLLQGDTRHEPGR
jgi:molybdenum cofactor synthesis domain-containing protein